MDSLVSQVYQQFVYSYVDTAQATPGLVLPQERTTGLGCIPEGRTVSYQCTFNDTSPTGSTTWLGSALNCTAPRSSQINLPHPAPDSTVIASCTTVSGGLIRAFSVLNSGIEYTSTLTLTATAEMNGKMINCTISSPDGPVLIGLDTIRVGGE